MVVKTWFILAPNLFQGNKSRWESLEFDLKCSWSPYIAASLADGMINMISKIICDTTKWSYLGMQTCLPEGK